jgi:methylisocitrate lyase
VEAGADLIFAEALTEPEHFRQFASAMTVPILANITEFGRTPLLSREELGTLGVRLVLYPLTAFRAMSAAAVRVYGTLRSEGTQQGLIPELQTRAELYDVLDYYRLESQLERDDNN